MYKQLTCAAQERSLGTQSCPPESLKRAAKHLMREIDARYERGAVAGIENLEVLLEAILESSDAMLQAADEDLEPGADLEPDPHEGLSIEEQLIGAYEHHLSCPASFPLESLRANLHDALEGAQKGGMTPSGYRRRPPTELMNLARQLHQEHREWIASRRNNAPSLPDEICSQNGRLVERVSIVSRCTGS